MEVREVRKVVALCQALLDPNPKMATHMNWFVGDENGNIKYISVVPAKPDEIDARQPHIILAPTSKNLQNGKPGAGVQRLNVRNSEERSLVGLKSPISLESLNNSLCS
jgi:hypothetical protein